jgi:hypothetical protein
MRYHLTVFENIWRRWNESGGLRVFTAAGYPPAPLTGDVGRGCGDASRALLLFPTSPGSIEDDGAPKGEAGALRHAGLIHCNPVV